MHTLILIVTLISVTKVGIAQSISTQMGARSSGIGYASSGLSDEWSLFNNPGGLGKIEQINTAFAYEVRPLLKGANRLAAVFNNPLKWGTLATGLFRFGDDLYNEQTLTLGFGNKIGLASLGVRGNLIQYHANGFGISRALSVDFGGIAQLTEQLYVNAYIINLTQSSIGEDRQPLPTRLTAGLSYHPEKHVYLATELSKELDYSTTWRTGIEYSFQQKAYFRTGFNLKPNAAFFGLGIHKKKIKIDYALQLNPLTGAAHQASASYWFIKRDKK